MENKQLLLILAIVVGAGLLLIPKKIEEVTQKEIIDEYGNIEEITGIK